MDKSKIGPKIGPKIEPKYTQVNQFEYRLKQLFPITNPINGYNYIKIVTQLNKFRSDVTKFDVVNVLKELKLAKYYGYAPYLAYKFNNGTNIIVDDTTIDKLVGMFDTVVTSFHKLENSRRTHLNQQYILHKLCELDGLTEMDKYLEYPSQNNRSNEQNDEIWYSICKYLGWKFIETCPTNEPKDLDQVDAELDDMIVII